MKPVVVRPTQPLGREQLDRFGKAVRKTLGYHAVQQMTQSRSGVTRTKNLPVGLVKNRDDGEKLIKALEHALPGVKFRIDATAFIAGKVVVWSDEAGTPKP